MPIGKLLDRTMRPLLLVVEPCRPNGALKIHNVRLGLEIQHVVLEQISDEFSMVRRGDKQVRRRERYMEKNRSDFRIRTAATPQPGE